MTQELIAVDLGGTNVRFCRARIENNRPVGLSDIRKYKVADFASLADAWRRFEQDEDDPLPDEASVAVAGPVPAEGPVKMTNTSWVIDRDALKAELSLSHLTLVNDFAAVAHGVAALPPAKLAHLFGPDTGLPSDGVVTVVGPGTGLGVAMAVLGGSGCRILPTEGGHVSYAPFDAAEDLLLHRLRARFGRVSAERVVSGPGLNAIYAALAEMNGEAVPELSDADLWARALGQASDGTVVAQDDALANRALAQFFSSYGSVVGDYALAHLSKAIVLAGGLTARMKGHPGFSAFHDRFTAKGRYRELMCGLPVYYADHPEIGLFGAAAAGVG